MEPRPTSLEYTRLTPPRPSRAGPLARPLHRNLLKLTLAVVVLGSVFVTGARFGQLARQQVPALFGPSSAVRALDQRPGHVVYEELPVAAATLLANPNVGGSYLNPFNADTPAAVWSEPGVRDIYGLVSHTRTTALDHGAQALLAELATAAGQTRIVSVRYLPAGRGINGLAGFLVETFDVDGVLGDSQRVFRSFSADIVAAMDGAIASGAIGPDGKPAIGVGGRDLRIFGGQVDPNDPSHFTINYEAGGVRGVLDGYLLDDGRTIEFGLRTDGIRALARPGQLLNPISFDH